MHRQSIARLGSTRPLIRFWTAFILLATFLLATMPVSLQTTSDTGTMTPDNGKPEQFVSWPSTFEELKTLGASQATAKSTGGARAAGKTYYTAGIEFKTPAGRQAVFTNLKKSTIPGAYVITAIDRFADVFIETDAAYSAIINNPAVLRVEGLQAVEAPPPPDVTPSTVQGRGRPEAIVRGGYKGLTGKGVVIAIVDTGIDFRHPDFVTYDAAGQPTSRIKYLWDTSLLFRNGRGGVSPIVYPNGGSIGTLFDQTQLTAELRRARPTIPATDENGHGTACASIAAGNGNADKRAGGLGRYDVVGVAPDADIIGIRMGPGGSFANAYLLAAIAEWLDKAVGAKPLVVSGSFGGQYSGHDGETVRERHLNARFPLTQMKRAIVLAAGNEGADRIHAKLDLTTEPRSVSWISETGGSLRIYFDHDPNEKFRLAGSAQTPVSNENVKWELSPITNQWMATVKVGPGPGSMSIQNIAGRQSEVHLYFSDESIGMFDAASATPSHLVGSPGTMENAITVGSYDWNNSFNITGTPQDMNDPFGKPITVGWLSTYSSRGPLRPTRVPKSTFKPEIVAPGQYYTSAGAKINGVIVDWDVDKTREYVLMNGTSAATPYTAGIVALMFQKKPTLTLGDVKRLLVTHSTKSGLNPISRSSLPNNEWGNGKLDMAAVDRIFAAL